MPQYLKLTTIWTEQCALTDISASKCPFPFPWSISDLDQIVKVLDGMPEPWGAARQVEFSVMTYFQTKECRYGEE